MAETVQAYAVEFVPQVVFLREEDAEEFARQWGGEVSGVTLYHGDTYRKPREPLTERAAKAALEGGAE